MIIDFENEGKSGKRQRNQMSQNIAAKCGRDDEKPSEGVTMKWNQNANQGAREKKTRNAVNHLQSIKRKYIRSNGNGKTLPLDIYAV